MNGRKGWISGTHHNIIVNARREFRKTPKDGGPAYRNALDLFIGTTYHCLGLKAPTIYRFSSPLAALLAAPVIAAANDSPTFEMDLLTDLRSSLTNTIGEKPEVLTSSAQALTGSGLTQALLQPLEMQTNERFEEAFDRDMVRLLGPCSSGYRYLCHGKFLIPQTATMKWWREIAANDLWIWPYKKFVIVSEPPARVAMDDQKRFHKEDDAAVEFDDGYRVWAWHGVLVPKMVILFPEALAFEHVEAAQNIEVRRIMIERIGPGKYLKGAGAVLLDMDSLTMDGSAPRALMVDKLKNKWLVGTDGSTKRVYTMAVPSDVTTCREAHERICGFDESRLVAEA